MKKCRICARCKPRKTVSDIKVVQNGITLDCKAVVLFCLGIQISDDPVENTYLCIMCYRKIIQFHEFKVLALKNDKNIHSAVTETTVDTFNFVKPATDYVDDREEIENVKEEIEDVLLDIGVKDDNSYDSDALSDEGNFVYELKEEDSQIDEDLKVQDGLINQKLQVKIEPDDLAQSVVQDLKHQTDIQETALNEGRVRKTSSKCKNKNNKTQLSKGEREIKKKKSIQSRSGTCDKCGKCYKNLSQHILTHLPLHERPKVKCKFCDKVFVSGNYKHMRLYHKYGKQTCNMCGKSVRDLRIHMRTIHMKDTFKFECVYCEKKFLTQALLRSHTKHHTDTYQYGCEICASMFKNKSSLSTHILTVHKKIKPNKCHLCPKCFYKKSDLVNHMRAHNNEKPFECNECGKLLQNRTCMKSHLLLHKPVKDVKCTLCDSAFRSSSQLNTHMMSHLKVKKYECRFCSARYHRPHHRSRHERTAHNNQRGQEANPAAATHTDTKPIYQQ